MNKIEKSNNFGTPISELDFEKVNIGDFLVALQQFENALKHLSYEFELDVYDLNDGLAYTKDGRLVDTKTETIQPFVYPVQNPYFENLKCLSEALSKIFMEGEFKSQRLQQLQKECLVGGCMRPSVFIGEALEKMDRVIDVNSIADYQKGLSLLRK